MNPTEDRTLTKDAQEMLEEGLQKLMDKYEVHVAFYLSTLKKFKNMRWPEREELKGFLQELISELIALDFEDPEYMEELERRFKVKREMRKKKQRQHRGNQ